MAGLNHGRLCRTKPYQAVRYALLLSAIAALNA
jgi:hypothetical protein